MKRIYMSLVAVAVTATVAFGQDDLTKEITIEREIVPEVRAAARINLPAAAIAPSVTLVVLPMSERAIEAPVTPMIATLAPVSGKSTVGVSPYRGYAAAGYFPAADFGVSAGYRFVDTRNTSLGAWLRFDANSYKGCTDVFSREKSKFSNRTVTGGIGFSHRFGRSGRLALAGKFTCDRFNYPWASAPDSVQNVTLLGFSALWNGETRFISYRVSAVVDYAAYSKSYIPKGFTAYDVPDGVNPVYGDRIDRAKAMNDLTFRIGSGVDWKLSDIATPGIDVDFETVRYNVETHMSWRLDDLSFSHNSPAIRILRDMYQFNGASQGILTLAPRIDFKGHVTSVRLGVRAFVYTGDINGWNVAPDVRFTWTPSSKFAFYANVGGVSELQTLSTIYAATRYLYPFTGNGASFIPVDAEAGFVIGPFHGASLQLTGGYSYADDCMMPEFADGVNYMEWTTMKGFRFGLEAAYEYRDILKATVKLESAPGNDKGTTGYYRWADRADVAMNVSLTVRPVDRLTVGLGYHMRTGRQIMVKPLNTDVNYPAALSAPQLWELGDLSNFSVDAGYDLTPQLSVNCRLENLFQKEYFILNNVPGRRAHGLVGLTCKF